MDYVIWYFIFFSHYLNEEDFLIFFMIMGYFCENSIRGIDTSRSPYPGYILLQLRLIPHSSNLSKIPWINQNLIKSHDFTTIGLYFTSIFKFSTQTSPKSNILSKKSHFNFGPIFLKTQKSRVLCAIFSIKYHIPLPKLVFYKTHPKLSQKIQFPKNFQIWPQTFQKLWFWPNGTPRCTQNSQNPRNFIASYRKFFLLLEVIKFFVHALYLLKEKLL